MKRFNFKLMCQSINISVSRVLSILLLFVPVTFRGQGQPVRPQDEPVDFRYSPQSFFATICLPADWQKTVVTEKGGLGSNFGPGPYAVPLTEVWFGAKEDSLVAQRQCFEDPRVPRASLELVGRTVTAQVEAFPLLPKDGRYLPPRLAGGRVRRLGGFAGGMNWAMPQGKVDPAFRNVAWGVTHSIQYLVRVARGARKVVALGICEPYKKGPGARPLLLKVEGDTPRRVDPLQDSVRNKPYVFLFNAYDENQDGEIAIESQSAVDGPDPNPILNVFWVFPEGSTLDTTALVRGDLSSKAELYYDCGPEAETAGSLTRVDVLTGRFERIPGVNTAGYAPLVNLRAAGNVVLEPGTGIVKVDGVPFLRIVPAPVAQRSVSGIHVFELPSGTAHVRVLAAHGHGTSRELSKVPDLKAARRELTNYMLKRAGLPFGKITVPDSTLQYILDCNIRNLYQMREVVDGVLQFETGPSVYRALWVGDAVYQLLAALLLNDRDAASKEINAVLRHELPDGQMRINEPWTLYRETPIMIHMIMLYAEYTHDTTWLRKEYGRIRRGVEWIRKQRASTLVDTTAVNYGLIPPGFGDGGLAGVHPEYPGVLWSLAGIRRAEQAAKWLGETRDAKEWSAFDDEFQASVRKAIHRDLRRDRYGNLYLPAQVGDTSASTPPQRAQWGILETQLFARIFDSSDPLLKGTLDVLKADAREGLPVNTGWLANGLWGWFGAINALADLELGYYTDAQDLLYAYANHACPFGTWVEEQMPKDLGTRTGGDASNASGSAFYIILLQRMLALERNDSLQLLAGVPDRWLAQGGKFALDNVRTKFGLVSLNVDINTNKGTAQVSLRPLNNGKSSGKVSIVLGGFRRAGYTTSGGGDLPERLRVDEQHGLRMHLVKR